MSWWYEVEAAVDTVIFNLTTGHARFLIQIILIFTVNKVDDWLPARDREERKKTGRKGILIFTSEEIPSLPLLFPSDN